VGQEIFWMNTLTGVIDDFLYDAKFDESIIGLRK